MSDFALDPSSDTPPLREAEVDCDPLVQVARWYEEARAASVSEPDAMALATATPDARPSVRMVLFKGLWNGALAFVSNYESRKARELRANPRAALCFFWREQRRQIRIEGAVHSAPEAWSDRYFDSRPPESRLSAWVSPQSEVIADRDELLERWQELESDGVEDLPRPPFWGGYLLVPEAVELWQGRAHRLHDRLRYRREGEGWELERLAP